MKKTILNIALLATFILPAMTTYSAEDTTANYGKFVVHKPAKTVQSDYAQTKYPVVFAHGLFGFGSVVGIDYYYQILPDLARNGASVWNTRVSTMHSSEFRGQQTLDQVEEVLAITGAEKVHLIGHSHGGQSVRFVAGVAPEKVASVTTIASGNQGAKIATLLEGVLEGSILEKPARAIFDNLVSPVITFASGLDSKVFPYDAKAALKALAATESQKFNQKFPNGVPTTPCGSGDAKVGNTYYFSFMGNSAFNTPLDPSDYGLAASGLLAGADNDGVTERCSSRFGHVVRDTYKWNHVDEINHLLSLKARSAPSAVDVYRQHVNRLKQIEQDLVIEQ